MTIRMRVSQDWEIQTSEEMTVRLKNSRDARAPLYERAKRLATEKGYVSPVGKALQEAVFSVEVASPGQAVLVMEWDQDETPRAKQKVFTAVPTPVDEELDEYMRDDAE